MLRYGTVNEFHECARTSTTLRPALLDLSDVIASLKHRRHRQQELVVGQYVYL